MIEPIPDRLDRTLRQTLAPGERVFIKLRGAFTEALICADSRVIILKGGWMTGQIFGTDTFQCPYANIAGAEVKFHLLTGYFELSAGGMQNTPKSFWRTDNKVRAANAPNCVSLAGPEQANRFRQASAFIMARTPGGRQPYAAGNEALAALERLANLRASGVLSEPEFRAMKARLLSSKP
ncbi:MAG: SHOCT domain-containing protein [Terriglobales bacterium]